MSFDDRVLIVNPTSGDESHLDRVTRLGQDWGFEVRVTEGAGDAAAFAREAGDGGAGLVGAAGGDGTVNEVLNGLVDADALDRTTLAVVPAGTGNNFATNIGVPDIETAFEVIEDGDRRKLDLGIANDRAFLNSCVGGLTAEASDATDSELKRQYGVLAYAVAALETAVDFDPLSIRVEAADPDSDDWVGDAVLVLIGNCRRFSGTRAAQANVEDGRFEVVIVPEAPPSGLVSDAAFETLFDAGGDHVRTFRTAALSIESRQDDPVSYSLDGEMLAAESLALRTRPGAVEVLVGEGYDPNPDEA